MQLNVMLSNSLQGMQDRANLSGSPELGLKNAIAHRDNVDDYGNLVYDALIQVSVFSFIFKHVIFLLLLRELLLLSFVTFSPWKGCILLSH